MIKKERKLAQSDFRSLKKPNFFLKDGILSAKVFKVAGESRFSFSISKKVAKNAVERNKAKRMGFLALRQIIGKIKPGWAVQLSFISLPTSQSELENNLVALIKNIK